MIPSPTENAQRRRIGLASAVFLVIANMLGTGVFTTSGFSLADLGSPNVVLAAWAVGGVIAFCGALSYGALARRIPRSGGEYTFLAETVHPLAGFLAGWVSLFAGFTAPIAAAAIGLQVYLGTALGTGDSVRPEWIGTAAIVFATVMHALRVESGVFVQNTAVIIKLVAIGLFVGLGAYLMGVRPSPAAAIAPAFDLGSFAVTLVWISFAYSGWNAAVYVGGEVVDPDRNLPRSLALATLIVTALYLSLNAVFLYSAPVSELVGRADIGAVAADALGGAPLRRALSALVGLALFTSISSMVMTGPRVYMQMAEDGLFPRLFRGGDVPSNAVALQGALAIAVVWSTNLAQLFSYIGFMLGVSAIATVLGLLATRWREGADRVPIPGYPWIPIVYLFGTAGASLFLIARKPDEALFGLATVLLGLPVYAAMQRWSAGRA